VPFLQLPGEEAGSGKRRSRLIELFGDDDEHFRFGELAVLRSASLTLSQHVADGDLAITPSG